MFALGTVAAENDYWADRQKSTDSVEKLFCEKQMCVREKYFSFLQTKLKKKHL
jgi:hypothetical protein